MKGNGNSNNRRRSRRETCEKNLVREDEFVTTRSPLKPLNTHQADYLQAILSSPQVVGLGPAGTGKSYVAAVLAADLYRLRDVSRIIITRPNVPGGRSLGYFPGTLEEKFGPWAAQMVGDIKDRLGESFFNHAFRKGQIEFCPFEVMRGRSWDNAFILLDEAQNTTPDEMKLFLTRTGEHSKVVVNGDLRQSDVGQFNGLQKMIDLIDHHDLPVPVIRFTFDDIVRSGLCKQWVLAFEGEL